MAKSRHRGKTMEQMAAERLAARMRDFEAVGLSSSQAALTANADVEVDRAGQRNAERARRMDAFEALRRTMDGPEFAGAYDAARRLDRDMTIRRGEHDQGRGIDRVDNGLQSATKARLDQILQAGETIDAVLSTLGRRDRELLTMLTDPPRGRFGHWRQIVAYVTGERNGNAQGAAVRGACVNLRDAYRAHDDERAKHREKAA